MGALQELFWLGGGGMTGIPMAIGSTAIPGAVVLAAAELRDAAYAFAPWLMH